MFNSRWKLAFTLIIVAGLSYWLLDMLIIDDKEAFEREVFGMASPKQISSKQKKEEDKG